MANIENAEESTLTVLLFGLPRSGTTWIGKIFDSHPSTLYRHEPDSWRKIAGVSVVPTGDPNEADIHSIRAFTRRIASINAAKVCAKTPVFPKQYLSAGGLRAYQAGIQLSRIAGKLGIEMPVIGSPRQTPPDGTLVWKSIESVCRLGLVLQALPQARAILLLRHPCGYVASVLRGESLQRFEDNRGASEDYGILQMLLETELARERELDLDQLRALAPEERLAWRWVLSNDMAMRASQATKRCKIVRYEDVCNNPLPTMKGAFDFLGIGWSSQTEEFIHRSTVQDQESYYSVFKDPKKAAQKWRDELPPETISRILKITGDTASGRQFADGIGFDGLGSSAA